MLSACIAACLAIRSKSRMYTPSAKFARQGPTESANAGGNSTSWVTPKRATPVGNMADEFAQFSASDSSGPVVIFRVRVDSIPEERLFQGREDKAEFLLEGTVEEVSISESAADEEENSND